VADASVSAAGDSSVRWTSVVSAAPASSVPFTAASDSVDGASLLSRSTVTPASRPFDRPFEAPSNPSSDFNFSKSAIVDL
jgi:hypothetical protein